MNKTEVVQKLKSMGTAQNRKIYTNHGIQGAVYGVSYANLGKLRKTIKIDHVLAERLWATGVYESRVLATMIADPERVTMATADAWLADITDGGIAGAFSELAYRTPVADRIMRKWTRARDEWKSTCGWNIVGHRASHDDAVDEDYLKAAIETIEAKIHKSPNRTRYAMNCALIAIGRRNPKLRKAATAAAKRIGPVEVDHGKTCCKTPDASAAIAKAWAKKK